MIPEQGETNMERVIIHASVVDVGDGECKNVAKYINVA